MGENVTGQVLRHLSDSDLRQWLGIAKEAQRAQLVRAASIRIQLLPPQPTPLFLFTFLPNVTTFLVFFGCHPGKSGKSLRFPILRLIFRCLSENKNPKDPGLPYNS